MKHVADSYTLRNGVKIPCVGFGTFRITERDAVVKAMADAVAAGYRHFDTATRYENEAFVGEGIASCGLKREDLFITSKVWTTERGYEKTLKAFNYSLKELKLDYLDMYLIHWPAVKGDPKFWQAENRETWRAMEKLYREGLIRAIGVCNFLPHHLSPLMESAEIQPMVDQIEHHPGYTQNETVQFCKEHGIQVEAWGPFGVGAVLAHPLLKEIAQKYGKSVAQLVLRWNIQENILPLPKSVKPERMAANADIFDFVISDEDMRAIGGIPLYGWSGAHPDEFDE